MAQTTTELNIALTDTFENLPEGIKSWVASHRVTLYIYEINQKLGIRGEKMRLIPQLVMRLVLRDLLPQDFINEIAKALNAPLPAAKALAQEISDKILKPIEIGLRRDVGVDIKLIFFGKAKEIKEEALQPLEAGLESEAAPVPLAFEEKPAEVKPLARTETKPREEIAVGETPVLIYKEGTVGRIPIAKAEPEAAIKTRVVPPPPPIPARPATTVSPAIQPQITKVVHYSDFFTPLNNLGLEKKSKTNNSALLDGNVIDLRFT